jgi:peptidoglycan/xylan/chitin deacetylase (PgdA/CDA1 family)
MIDIKANNSINARQIRRKLRKAISFVLYTTGLSFIIQMVFNRNKIYAPILCYHVISDNSLNGALPVYAFEKQLAYLQANRYTSIEFGDLLDALNNERNLPSRPIVITFDDSSLSHFSSAYPLLKKYGFKATFFVSSRLVTNNGEKLKAKHDIKCLPIAWNHIIQMAKDGFTFGGHTRDHVKLPLLDPNMVEIQINKDKEILESMLGKRVEFFAYPYGAFNRDIINIIKKNGFKSACSSDWGTHHDVKRKYCLQRVSVEADDSLFNFKLKLKGGYDWLGLWMQVKRKWRE